MVRPQFRTQERISWRLAALSMALAFGFWGALDAYLNVRSPSAHDMAEPFMALWASGTAAMIVLLSLGAVALGGWWRPFVILASVPLAGLVWLWVNNLVGALGDGSVSPIGLLAGALQSAQIVAFAAWLGLILWWRDSWSRARVILPLALVASTLAVTWDVQFPWYGAFVLSYWDPPAVAIVVSVWGPLATIAIGSLILGGGDSSRPGPILQGSVLLAVAVLWALYMYLAYYAVVTDRLNAATVTVLAAGIGLLGVLSLWLGLTWRWARMRS